MEKISKLLMAIDAVKTQIASKQKNNADDYYEMISPINDRVIKMNDGGMVSFFKLKGFSRTLLKSEMKETARSIEKDLVGYIDKPGFSFQMVEIADPELSKQNVQESMQESIDELHRMGIGHPLFTTDYVDFIASKSVWKEQFLIVYTSPLAVKGVRVVNDSDEKKLENEDKSAILRNVIKENVLNQGVFLSDVEKEILAKHRDVSNAVFNVFSRYNSIISPMDVSDVLKSQKKAIYGKDADNSWEPNLGSLFISKEEQTKNNKVKVQEAKLVEQVLSVGGTEAGLPVDIIRFGDRYFSTISLVVPQDDQNNMKHYRELTSNIDKNVGYMSSVRMSTDPFSDGSFRLEKAYASLSSIVPFTDNLLISRAQKEFKSQCDNNDKVGVFVQISVTFYSRDLEELQRIRNRALSGFSSWGGAQFRTVELNKTQGFFDTVPGASKKSSLKQVLESFADTLYQSPLFNDGIIYKSGYIHFFTESLQPFPFEEHSSLNINFNGYICGTSGSGKSTILTLLNLGLMAKPKLNPKLRGEFPLIMDVDFGKTSFGFKGTIRSLVGEEKKSMFLMHEMSTDPESAINPHDLPFGRLSPTKRHKDILTRFLLILISGVEETEKGFKVAYPELEGMVNYMIDAVYDHCREENEPRMFESAEFLHKSTLSYLDKNNIPYGADYSYYHISDLVMKHDPKRGIKHAMLLRRYGYPRLSDYTNILTERSEIAARFSQGVVARGLNAKDFFMQKMAEISNEYPCFTRVSKVNLDFARMISIDIEAVCGENESRKAIFGSLCLMLFLVKRENLEGSKDLLSDAPEIYHPYLKKLSTMNRVLPATLNIEEAHVLYALFDKSLKNSARQNRKQNWGLRTLSQNLEDPSDELFSLCSTVLIASEQNGDEVENRLKSINASQREKQLVNKELKNRKIFAYIKTKPSPAGVNVSRIATPLMSWFSPGLIWASNSDQTDIDFKDNVISKIGTDVGLTRLSRFFPSGNVKSLLEDTVRLRRVASNSGFDNNYEYLLHEVTTREYPSEQLQAIL